MDQLTVEDALNNFYIKARLDDNGGIDSPFVRIELINGIYVYMPNFETRRKVLLKHDIHHLLTGYSTTMKGESEISAWELSTGCRHNWAAFTLNTWGMMTGVVLNLPGVWRAWLRGKTTKNLYKHPFDNRELLQCKIAQLRNELGLDGNFTNPRKTTIIFFEFILFLVFGTLFSTLSLVIIPFILLYTILILLKGKWRQ